MVDSELIGTIASAMLKQCTSYRTTRRMIAAVEANMHGEPKAALLTDLNRRLSRFEKPAENERGG